MAIIGLGHLQRALSEALGPSLEPRAEQMEELRLFLTSEAGELARVLLRQRNVLEEDFTPEDRDNALGSFLVAYAQLSTLTEGTLRFDPEVWVAPESPSALLARAVTFANEEFPAIRFSRVVTCLSRACGLRRERSIEIFTDSVAWVVQQAGGA